MENATFEQEVSEAIKYLKQKSDDYGEAFEQIKHILTFIQQHFNQLSERVESLSSKEEPKKHSGLVLPFPRS